MGSFRIADGPGVGSLRSTLWRFSFLYPTGGVESVIQEEATIWAAIANPENGLGNDDANTDTPAHFLRILSMAFPLASSSTNLSR